jgi:hypothetical protein
VETTNKLDILESEYEGIADVNQPSDEKECSGR